MSNVERYRYYRNNRQGRKAATISGEHAVKYGKAKARLIFFAAFIVACYLVVGFRVVDLTIFRDASKIVKRVVSSGKKRAAFTGLRSDIVDRNGDLIASTIKMSSAYANPKMVENPVRLAVQLQTILPDLDYKTILRRLESGKSFVWIKRNITPKQKYAINALGNPAVSFQEENRRFYPNGNLVAHIAGYTDIDGHGIAGVENYFDDRLKGNKEPLQLSLDLKVQHALRSELASAMKKFRAKAAIGMVMNVNTGELISVVSLPDFDPNDLKSSKADERFNRATLGVFEMGSTFKLFSVAAALDSKKVKFSTKIDVRKPIKVDRYTISDFHSKKRPLTIPEIFIYSSNIGTAKMAESLGNERMESFFRDLGFLDKVQEIELPERGSPIYPFPWRDINTLTTSFGHGIAVSPLHLVRAASALVNGGLMPEVTLVKREDNSLQDTPVVLESHRVVSEDTSVKLRQLLELVVVGGTGNNAYVQGYNVGGKTGTAEKNINGEYRKDALFSSFLGMFPMEDPEYAILAILDEPQPLLETRNSASGGWTAAPVVAKVVKHMGSIYQIPPAKELSHKRVERKLRPYLKDFKEGSKLASVGTDR